ncbi:MAG: hypothetical protein AUF67_01800 [Acidobacteria bacterium 13_1_20CM_58_21]|nr:MAG: hypothetical protein AUF67_01800 [Acidobacteria bacterium 13_1_20CM_58_21]
MEILPAMNGRDSYGVPAGFAGISGFLPQPPYFSRGLRLRLYFRAIRPLVGHKFDIPSDDMAAEE